VQVACPHATSAQSAPIPRATAATSSPSAIAYISSPIYVYPFKGAESHALHGLTVVHWDNSVLSTRRGATTATPGQNHVFSPTPLSRSTDEDESSVGPRALQAPCQRVPRIRVATFSVRQFGTSRLKSLQMPLFGPKVASRGALCRIEMLPEDRLSVNRLHDQCQHGICVVPTWQPDESKCTAALTSPRCTRPETRVLEIAKLESDALRARVLKFSLKSGNTMAAIVAS